jgi:hypothetical protein
MKEVLNLYKSYTPVLLISIYSIGFVYLKGFYSSFGIPIEYYISLTDIIFFTISNTIYFIFWLIIIEAILFPFILGFNRRIIFLKIRSNSKIKNKSITIKDRAFSIYKNRNLKESYLFYSPYIFTLFVIIALISTKELTPILITLFPAWGIKLFLPNKILKEVGDLKFEKLIWIAFISVILISFFISGNLQGKNVKKNEISKKITIRRENYSILSSNSGKVIYIGETSEYIFFYDIGSKYTQIVEKTGLDEFIIKDPVLSN